MIRLSMLWTQVLQKQCTMASMFYDKVLRLNISHGYVLTYITIYNCLCSGLDQYTNLTIIRTM